MYMKKKIIILSTFIVIALFISFFCMHYTNNSYSLPLEDNIIRTNNIDEVIKYSSNNKEDNFVSVNTETGDTSSGDFEDLEGGSTFEEVISDADTKEEKKEKVVEYLADSEFYAINGEAKNKIDVVAIYSNKRIRVNTTRKNIDTYGATGGVFFDDYYILTYDTPETTKNAYEKLKIKYGEENVILDIPVKVSSAKGWGTSLMSFDTKMLEIGSSSNKVTVAVLDTGINANHEIFKNHTILPGKNFVNPGLSPRDNNGHGTAVSGIIAESTGSNVTILPIKVLYAKGGGSILDVLLCLDYANSQNAKIANMSLGINLYRSDYSRIYSNNAIYDTVKSIDEQIADFHMIMICASGNENSNADLVYSYPAVSEHTISVGSIDKNKKVS